MRKNGAFVAKIVNTHLTKIFMAIFAPDERLPSSATLTFSYPVQKIWSVQIESPSSIKEAHENMTTKYATIQNNGRLLKLNSNDFNLVFVSPIALCVKGGP